MDFPQFTAEQSLGPALNHYVTTRQRTVTAMGTGQVVPSTVVNGDADTTQILTGEIPFAIIEFRSQSRPVPPIWQTVVNHADSRVAAVNVLHGGIVSSGTSGLFDIHLSGDPPDQAYRVYVSRRLVLSAWQFNSARGIVPIDISGGRPASDF